MGPHLKSLCFSAQLGPWWMIAEGRGVGSGRWFRWLAFCSPKKSALDKMCVITYHSSPRPSSFQKGWEHFHLSPARDCLRGHCIWFFSLLLLLFRIVGTPYITRNCPLWNFSPSRLINLIRSPNWHCSGNEWFKKKKKKHPTTQKHPKAVVLDFLPLSELSGDLV